MLNAIIETSQVAAVVGLFPCSCCVYPCRGLGDRNYFKSKLEANFRLFDRADTITSNADFGCPRSFLIASSRKLLKVSVRWSLVHLWRARQRHAVFRVLKPSKSLCGRRWPFGVHEQGW